MAKIKGIVCVKNAIWSLICYQLSKDCTRSVVKLTNTARNSTPAQDQLPNKLESLTLPQSSLVPSLEDLTVVDLHQCRPLVVFQLPTASQTNHTIKVSAPKIQASLLLRWAAMAWARVSQRLITRTVTTLEVASPACKWEESELRAWAATQCPVCPWGLLQRTPLNRAIFRKRRRLLKL